MHPEAEHVLDWFHVAMRVAALGQMVKGAARAETWRDKRLGDLERVKQLLWHGHAREAEASIGWIEADVEAEHDDAVGERRAELKRLGAESASSRSTYTATRAAWSTTVNGIALASGFRRGFVESAINQVVAKRFSKRQSMRWTRRGTHLALQTRTRVLNGDLDVAFRRRWPGFKTERAA